MNRCYLRQKLHLLLTMRNRSISADPSEKRTRMYFRYIYTYIYIYVCICIYLYVYIYAIIKTMCPPSYHHNDFVATHALGHMMHELPQSNCGDNKEAILFSWLHINFTHLSTVRFEHSVCCGSRMTIYIYVYVCICIYICIYIYIIYIYGNIYVYIFDIYTYIPTYI